MTIINDEDASSLIGSQVYIFSDNKLMPMVVSEVKIEKTYSGFGVSSKATIKTAIGDFSGEDVYRDKKDLFEYINQVIDN